MPHTCHSHHKNALAQRLHVVSTVTALRGLLPRPEAREGPGVGHPGGTRDDRGRPADDDRAREEEGLHVLVAPVADGRAQAEDLQAAEEALST